MRTPGSIDAIQIKAILLMVAALIVSSVAACHPIAVSPLQRKLTIAWIPKALDNPIFELGRHGAAQKAAELSEKGPVEVEVIYVGPVTADAAEQMRLLDGVISKGVDAVAISCTDPTACVEPINRAVAAGIPVLTWDSDSPQSQRLTYYGVDNYLAGRVAGHLLVSALRGEGDVAILTGVTGSYNLEERIRGFKDVIDFFPQVHILVTVPSNEDINLGVQVLEETMQAYPKLDGWFFAGMWPLFAERGSMPYWEQAASQHGLQTVAFEALPVELELMRDGYLFGLVGQKYWSWGYDTIQILYDHMIYGRSYPKFIDSGINVVVKENVESILDIWQAFDLDRTMMAP
jgi:ribose transport system substrate-binding protein